MTSVDLEARIAGASDRAVSSVRLADALAPFATPSTAASLWQLFSSITAFAALWGLAFLSLQISYALTIAIALPAAFVLVRLFVIQHDCGHGSFFRWRRANDLLGAAFGVLTLTPYSYWRRTHAMHHGSSGNLDRRGLGDVETLTVREYLALGMAGRLKYRLCRNALVVLVAGPIYQFFVLHRLPLNLPASWRREWLSVVVNNAALVGAAGAAWWLIGLDRFVLVHLPITWLAGAIGVWLFYVQHQFEETYWAPSDEWQFERASLDGSSYFDLPAVLHWCTGNIGVHHVHHLCPRIPNYRLRAAADAHAALQRSRRLTLADAVRCFRLKLWDEDARRLVGFDAIASRGSQPQEHHPDPADVNSPSS